VGTGRHRTNIEGNKRVLGGVSTLTATKPPVVGFLAPRGPKDNTKAAGQDDMLRKVTSPSSSKSKAKTPARPAAKAPARPAAKAQARPAATAAAKGAKAPAKPAGKAPAKSPAKAPAKSAAKAPAKVAGKVPAKATPKVVPAAKAVRAAKAVPASKAVPAGKAVPAAKAGAKSSAKTVAAGAPAGKAKAVSKPAPPAKAKPRGDRVAFLAGQRQLLLDERANYLRSADTLKAQADSLALEHEPGDVQFDEEGGEGGTSNVDRELDLVLSAQARAAAVEIDRALMKIDAGTYGLCEQCGRPIPDARLQALPQAALCVACKSGGLSSRR